jgi:hypothetical protein
MEAKKAAEANLIARREETAAMRSQANTAKLLAWIPTDPHGPNSCPGQVPILPEFSPNCYRTLLS